MASTTRPSNTVGVHHHSCRLPRCATLIDGAMVQVRQLGVDDYDAVVELSLSLTKMERYMRFFTPNPGFLNDWARSITMRTEGRLTLGVFEDDYLIGTAGYIATTEPGRAEASVVVAHLQHERGVGTTLLHTLGEVAQSNDIHHLTADVLAENRLLRKVVDDCGWSCTWRLDGSVLGVDIDLDGAPRGPGSRVDDP